MKSKLKNKLVAFLKEAIRAAVAAIAGVAAFVRGPYKAILAGGIGESNIADAIALSPNVIDVNSSLETSPGVKSIARLKSFLASIPSSDRSAAVSG